MESGRPNIDALLNEEVNRTSGRMSVSGKYQFANLQELATYG
jgi:hypothetical protein